MEHSTVDVKSAPFDTRQILPNLKDFNLGIIIVAMHIFLDLGSLQNLFGPVVRALALPKIVPIAAISYAIYLVLSRRADISSALFKALVIFVIFTIVYTFAVTIHPIIKSEQIKLLLQYLSNFIILTTSIKTLRQLILFVDIILLALLHSSFHAIRQGGKIWFDTFLGDENEISVIMVIGFTLGFQMFMMKWHILKKIAYGFVLVNLSSIIVIANSRGGVLAWGASLLCCWLFIKHKVRTLLVLAVVVIAVLQLAPQSFFNEVETIDDGTEEGTAFDRVFGWHLGMMMFQDHPLLGVGPGNYPEYYPSYFIRYSYTAKKVPNRSPYKKRAAHSTPIQWFAETGIVGSALLLWLLYEVYRNWRKSAIIVKSMRTKESGVLAIGALAHGVAISMVAFWIGGSFITIFIWPFIWLLLPLSQIVLNLLDSRRVVFTSPADETEAPVTLEENQIGSEYN